MKSVVFYEATPDFMSKVPPTFEAGGALGVFTTRVAAEAFIAEDPFVKHGVVARHTIREWDEVLAP
jgi:uncharacterized protein YciI